MKKLICKGEAEEQQQKDLISAIVIEQKINQLESKLNKSEQKLRIRPASQKKESTQHFSKKSNAI